MEINSGYKTMQIISKISEGQEVSKEGLPGDMIQITLFLLHVPIGNHICERQKKFFYIQNFIIWQSPTFFVWNIKHTLVVQCNTFNL